MQKLTGQTIFKCSWCSRISKSAGGIMLHELSCKHNPHNHLLCADCVHCEKREHYGEEGSKCKNCWRYEPDENGCWNIEDCYECSEGRCSSMQRIVEFTCKIDGKKMYSPKVRRLAMEKRDAIIAVCDKPMADVVSGCRYHDDGHNHDDTDEEEMLNIL